MASTTVFGPSISSGLQANAGDTITVVAGGTMVNTTLAGGSLIAQGATTSQTLVSSGGSESLLASFSNFTNVRSGGSEVVGAGSVANSGTVLVGGSATVTSGGLMNGLFLGNVLSSPYPGFANLVVFSGGRTSGTVYNFWGYGDILSGAVASASQIRSNGDEVIAGGTSVSATVGAGGSETLLAGSASGTVVSSGGELFVASGSVAGVVSAVLRPGGTIALAGLVYASGGSAVLDPSTDLLTVSEGGQSTTLSLAGDYTGMYFHLAGIGASNPVTNVTVDGTPCYCPGTRILTDTREVEIERLRIGDRVVTWDGSLRPIRWIGQRRYARQFAARNPAVWPVIIRAGALMNGLPRRDLWVSPEHALFLDDMLVPAGALVNGTSIVRATVLEAVGYLHLELDRHDVVFAEGAAAETFLDDGSRGMFHNAAEFRQLYPERAIEAPYYCAARIEHGDDVERLRSRFARFARDIAIPG